MKRAKQTQSQSMFTSDTALGKPVLSHIYENPEDLDQTGAELDSIGPATGYPVHEQVLTTSFIWSSLTILINFRSRFGRLMAPTQLRKNDLIQCSLHYLSAMHKILSCPRHTHIIVSNLPLAIPSGQ